MFGYRAAVIDFAQCTPQKTVEESKGKEYN
jgi:hypothetical protein